MRHPKLEAVVAVARNGTIGRDNKLPWHLRTDLQRFRKLTTGHGLLMGRKTYESIGRPLPDRDTFVLSRNTDLRIPGCLIVQDYRDALDKLGNRKLFLVGGAEVYRQLLPHCIAIHITHVLANIEGESRLEPINLSEFQCLERIDIPAGKNDEWPSCYEHWRFVIP